MKIKIPTILIFGIVLYSIQACHKRDLCHDEMISILKKVRKDTEVASNMFSPEAGLPFLDSLLALEHRTPSDIRYCKYLKANTLMQLGQEDLAVAIYEDLLKEDSTQEFEKMWKSLAVAYLRQGERSNCISNHASESCILPLKGIGIHQNQEGSQKAIAIYSKLLKRNPNDLESRWLYNLAYMTLGEYPDNVPKELFVSGLEGDTTYSVTPFRDIASDLQLDLKNMAGGSITDDFDNDGYLDIITSAWGISDPMHYFRNNGDGTFSDLSDKMGLHGITGGLNIMQADYNNDGFKDVFVLRGGWKKEFGQEPNSLLRNNGDGTFTDVTTESGLLSYHPTQTATWNDFNNDGWLDLFIGNETSQQFFTNLHPCELYINNQDGTFREIASQAKINIKSYVKGVTSGDYNNDGWKDIFISTMSGERKLMKNLGLIGKEVVFENVTSAAGIGREKGNSFPTWFWDFDNDGWLDIFACDYSYDRSLAFFAAAEKLGVKAGNPEKMLLYRNNRDGTFTNVADEIGLNKVVFAMGSNFGDIDNDGYLDMYLGTGNPDFKSLIPNKMFKNIDGKKFADVTSSARVGHLQKGHGVSFADMDNDGDQDIYVEMGGASTGDAYQNSFFLNPGQGTNNWICLMLEGVVSNRSAIGSRIKITFRENGVSRSVYRDVNTGGSFGASPLRREIGIGQAQMIDEIEIKWHGSNTIQVFKDIRPNQFINIKEGQNQIQIVQLKTLDWMLPNQLCLPGMAIN